MCVPRRWANIYSKHLLRVLYGSGDGVGSLKGNPCGGKGEGDEKRPPSEGHRKTANGKTQSQPLSLLVCSDSSTTLILFSRKSHSIEKIEKRAYHTAVVMPAVHGLYVVTTPTAPQAVFLRAHLNRETNTPVLHMHIPSLKPKTNNPP